MKMKKNIFDIIIFVYIVCSYRLIHTCYIKNPETSEEMEYGIFLFPGTHDVLLYFSMIIMYGTSSN